MSKSPRGERALDAPSPRRGEREPEEDEFTYPCSKNDCRAAAVARQAGLALFGGGQFKDAIVQFEKACMLDKSNATNFELCAKAMLAHGDLGEARGKIVRAKELAPYSAVANILQCQLAMKKAKVEDVSESTSLPLLKELYVGFKEAYKLDHLRHGGGERCVQLEGLLNKLLPKGEQLPEFAQGVSEKAMHLRQKGTMAMGKKNWKDAFMAFHAAVEEEPENPMNYVYRSLSLSRLKAKGNPAEAALRDAKRALRLNHGLADAWAAMGTAWSALKQYDHALDAFEEGHRQDGRLVEAYGESEAKAKKGIAKAKQVPRRPEPWSYSEHVTKNAPGQVVERNEPTLEVDSLGEMTIRSQFKRVLLAHQVKHAEVGQMQGEHRPFHVSSSDLKSEAEAIPGRKPIPVSDAVANPRPVLRPAKKAPPAAPAEPTTTTNAGGAGPAPKQAPPPAPGIKKGAAKGVSPASIGRAGSGVDPAQLKKLADLVDAADGEAAAPPAWDTFVPPAGKATALPVLIESGMCPDDFASMSKEETVKMLQGEPFNLNGAFANRIAENILAHFGAK